MTFKINKGKRRMESMIILFAILGAIILIFIALPIGTMIYNENLNSLIKAIENKTVRNSILLSMFTAFCATLISLVFAIPLGYVLARRDFLLKPFIQGLVDVPIVVPHTVAGIALLTVFGRNGLIGAPLSEFNIRFVDAIPGIIVAMMFVSVPFVINSAREGFESVNPKLENVARSLGANQLKTFFTITLPLAARNIFTGCVMAWARAISEFGAVVILVAWPRIAPVLIYENWLHQGLSASRPIAVLLLILCLIIFVTLRVISLHWGKKKDD